MSKWNGLCDVPGCRVLATHHGPQYSTCTVHESRRPQPEITRIEPKVHDKDGQKTTVYWVCLLDPDGETVRALPTGTMTDACILSETLTRTVQHWATRLGS